jgi:hypothetical protein
MWSAKITDKQFKNGVVTVFVAYTNGTDEHTEPCNVLTLDQLNGIIDGRLKQLEIAEAFFDALEIKKFTVVEKETTPESEFAIASEKLRRLKSLVETGVIKEDDAEYVAAQQTAKDAYAALEK